MITLILSITLIVATTFAFWQLASWWVFRTATQRVEKAVLATSQTIVCNMLTVEPIEDRARTPGHHRKDSGLTYDEEEIAHRTAVEYAYHLLGHWHCLALRVALLRWDLSQWLDAEIESAVLNFKSIGLLPVSSTTMAIHNPKDNWLGRLLEQMAPIALQYLIALNTEKNRPTAHAAKGYAGPTPEPAGANGTRRPDPTDPMVS